MVTKEPWRKCVVIGRRQEEWVWTSRFFFESPNPSLRPAIKCLPWTKLYQLLSPCGTLDGCVPNPPQIYFWLAYLKHTHTSPLDKHTSTPCLQDELQHTDENVPPAQCTFLKTSVPRDFLRQTQWIVVFAWLPHCPVYHGNKKHAYFFLFKPLEPVLGHMESFGFLRPGHTLVLSLH